MPRRAVRSTRVAPVESPPRAPLAVRGALYAVTLLIFLLPLVGGLYSEPLPALWLSLLSWSVLLYCALLLPGWRAPAWPFSAAALLFLLHAAVTTPASSAPGASLIQIAVYGSQFALGYLAFGLALSFRALPAPGILLIVSAVPAGAGVAALRAVQEYLGMARLGDVAWRAGGGFTNPNFLAAYLCAGLAFALALTAFHPVNFKIGLWRAALFLLHLLLAGGLAVTGSRGGFVAAAAAGGLAASWVIYRSRREKQFPSNLATGLAGVAAAALLFSIPLASRKPLAAQQTTPPELCGETSAGATESSNRFRLLTWRDTYRMGAERPWTGWGAGTFEISYGARAAAGYTRHAHNSYLQLFAEGGALPVILLLFLAASGAFGLIRLSFSGDSVWWMAGAAAALIGMLLHGFLESLLQLPATGFLLFALAGMGLSAFRPGRALPGRAAALCAAAGWISVAWPLAGRTMLAAETNAGQSPSVRVEQLRRVRTMLPLDHEVARELTRSLVMSGDIAAALDEAQRTINLAPYRAASYLRLADLRVFNNELPTAHQTLRVALELLPFDVRLLYDRAAIARRLGWKEEALEDYRRIVEIHSGEPGQVRALGEFRDYRIPMARMALAAGANEAERLEQLRRGACELAERRRLLLTSPWTYMALPGEWDPTRERDLIRAEVRAWMDAAEVYRARGEKQLSELARKEASSAEASFEELRKLTDPAARAGE